MEFIKRIYLQFCEKIVSHKDNIFVVLKSYNTTHDIKRQHVGVVMKNLIWIHVLDFLS